MRDTHSYADPFLYRVSFQQTEGWWGRRWMQMFGESLSFIRSVPEDQVVGGYKEVHNRADCVLYMVANLQLKMFGPYEPLVKK